MIDYFSKIQGLSDVTERSVDPFMRIFGLVFAITMMTIPASEKRMSTPTGIEGSECCDEPRPVLMAGVRALSRTPFVLFWALLWVILGNTFVRHAGFRTSMLGGAAVAFIAAVVCLLSLEESPSNMDGILKVAMILAHVGFALGYWMSSSPLARRLDPKLKPGDDKSTTQGTQLSFDASEQSREESSTTSEEHPTTTSTDYSARQRIARLVLILGAVWFATRLCLEVVDRMIPFFTKPSEDGWFYRLESWNHKFFLFAGPPSIFGVLAWLYVQITPNVTCESSCGVVSGGMTLALLRFTASKSTWQSWAADGALAFVGLNLGLLGGLCLRRWWTSANDKTASFA